MSMNIMQTEEATWIDELYLLDAMCAQHLDRFNLYHKIYRDLENQRDF